MTRELGLNLEERRAHHLRILSRTQTRRIRKFEREEIGNQSDERSNDVLRIVGIILLVFLFWPWAFPRPDCCRHRPERRGILFSIAVGVIKLAIVLAICYLILVGIRAVLR